MKFMKKKTGSRPGICLLLAMGAVLLVCVNICASRLTSLLGLRLDMTGNRLYDLSAESVQILEELASPVEIRVFSTQEDFLPLVAEVLKRYERAGQGRVALQYVDPYANPTLVDTYLQRGFQVQLNSIVVEGAHYARALQLEEMFELDQSGNAVEQLNCEQKLTSAILYAAGTESPSVQFTAGHNEHVSDSLMRLFEQSNYQTGRVTLSLSALPDGTDLVVIASPTSDFSREEIASLDRFMAQGGRMAVFVEPSSAALPNLQEFLREWGIGLTDAVVAEPLQYTDANPLSIVPLYSAHPINQYFSGNQLYLVMPSTRALEQLFVSQAGIRTQKLLYSTDRAYDFTDVNGEKGLFTLAMTAEKVSDAGTARLVAIGSRGLYSDQLLQSETCGNAKFLTQVMNWCTETDSAVSIPPKNLSGTPLPVTVGQVLCLAAVLVVLLPLGVLIVGLRVYRRRRHS